MLTEFIQIGFGRPMTQLVHAPLCCVHHCCGLAEYALVATAACIFDGTLFSGGGVGGLQTQKKKKKGKAANNLLNFSVAPPTGEIETI